MTFLLSGHHIDDSITPVYRKVDDQIEMVISNSSVTGILAFGGWVWPIEPTSDRGHIKLAIRDDGGDRYIFDDEYAAVLDPPNYTFQTKFFSKSEPWDTNDNNFGMDSGCFNIGNGARISKAAGVSATFTCDIEVLVNISLLGPNTCPPGGVPSQGGNLFTKRYTLVATFTG